VITTLTISPQGGSYRVGDFDVVIPAGAVCDPLTTQYGPAHWDSDCTPANRDVTVNVVAETHADRVSVDFKPDLRFRPSAGWVTIRTAAYSGLLTSDAVRHLSPHSSFFSNFVILYVPTGGLSHIDEVRSTGDPTLVTHVDRQTGILWRRVKHFSGYMVTSGDKCSTTAITTCTTDSTFTATGSGVLMTTLTVDTTSTSSSVLVGP
jgi:hypothetical protein